MTDRRMPPGTPEGEHDATVLPGAAAGRASLSLMDGRYRVERVIGEGAFGRVYLAVDTRLRRNVAIKELLASRNQTDSEAYARYLERFQREARAAGVVQHPNIVAVLELAIDRDENYYLVMEYIDGTDLRELLAQVRTLPVERAVRITLEVARALEMVHEQDIVHRDLKPANIMLTRRGVTKLADFGVAQVAHESQRTRITTGHPGTPLYMSPEQSAGYGYIDGRSDLYSLGLILYEMLTGTPYARQRRPLQEVRPDLSPDLVAIFDRLTAKDADARYADAGEVVAALGSLSSASAALTAIDLPPALPLSGGGSRSADTGSRASTPPAALSSDVTIVDGTLPGGYQSGAPVAANSSQSSADVAPTPVADARKRKRGLFLGAAGAVLAVGVVLAGLVLSARGQPRTPPTAQTSTATATPIAAQVTPVANLILRGQTATSPPTATPVAPTARATPTGGSGTDLSQWATSEVAGLYRRSFDPAVGEYHVILLKDNAVQPILTPETQSIADLSIEVDVRRVAGPDAGGFGVAFRVQPFGPGDKSHAAYIFVIDGQQRYALYQMKGDGTTTFIQAFTPLPAGTMNIGPNAVNHLTAICRGETITLAVNGTTLNTYPAAITAPGSIGVAVESPASVSGIEVAFRNLRVSPA